MGLISRGRPAGRAHGTSQYLLHGTLTWPCIPKHLRDTATDKCGILHTIPVEAVARGRPAVRPCIGRLRT